MLMEINKLVLLEDGLPDWLKISVAASSLKLQGNTMIKNISRQFSQIHLHRFRERFQAMYPGKSFCQALI